MKYIDLFLDRITMYRLLLYYLIIILCAAMLFGAVGIIPYSPYVIFISTVLAVSVCWITNYMFAKVYRAPTNPESSILTGLILALIITPPSSIKEVPFIIAAAGLAIVAKYILAINNKHIFNPVAIAVVLTALGPQQSASWWVGTVSLVPLVVIGGILVTRKIRRTRMVVFFFIVALICISAASILTHKDLLSTIQTTLLHSSLLFLGFVMLTEPMTSPTTWAKQRWYVLIVGICFLPELHIGTFYSTPEIALVLGNITAFFLTPRVKTILHLKSHSTHGNNSEDFIFTPEKRFDYLPGQYIELTLPHDHTDQRGSRRIFTLASSPTENDIRIGIRFYDKGSSFKRLLRVAGADLFLSAGQLGGDFTLPRDPNRKVAFIAGGIGVTPFRSMIKYLSDIDSQRSATLIYAESTLDNVSYSPIFEEAQEKIGLNTTYVISNAPVPPNQRIKIGHITPELIQTEIPDYNERIFYISGPQPMVQSVRRMLRQLGIKQRNIKVDYFSGYA